MNTVCRFFIAEDGTFFLNQKIGRDNCYIVGREQGKPHPSNITIKELSRQPDWKDKSHGGDALSTLIGGLFNLTDVIWVAVNLTNFRVELASGADREKVFKMVRLVLGVVVHTCIDPLMRIEEVYESGKVLSPEDRARFAEEEELIDEHLENTFRELSKDDLFEDNLFRRDRLGDDY